MTADADVIISGAGPAGSLAAYELAIRGTDVLILEKSRFPRYKVCGAGLTHKIIREIPFDVTPIFETEIHSIIFSKGFQDTFRRIAEQPVMYCTSRERFDQFLLQKALDAGARILYGEHVTGVIQDTNGVIISTRAGSFRSRVAIGADGASGNMARSVGLRNHILPGLAWEAEVMADPGIVRAYSGTIFLDWGAFPGGYAWVFPKSDHFSIGVGGPAYLASHMGTYYQQLVAYLSGGSWDPYRSDQGISILETHSMKSWPIPVRTQNGPFHEGRVIITGDAAGLTDPLTGEGIHYAVRSGILAAKYSHDYLHGDQPALAEYSRAINKELMTELIEANRIKHLFNTVPRRLHHLVRDHDRVWHAFGKILRGERRYVDVRTGFGRWEFLWSAACAGSKLVSGFRERRFLKNGFKS